MEYLDYVDENDVVIGVTTRANAKGLNVRIAATLIFNHEEKITLQKVARTKNLDALKWSYSSGGHVAAGESYEKAALRELKEEMGIDGIIDSYIGVTRSVNPVTGEKAAFHRVFKVIHDGPYHFDPTEAEEIKTFSIEELKQMVQTDSSQFKPTLVEIFKRMGIC